MKNKEIQDELNELSPFLSDLKKDKKEGFKMPANYFDRFEDRLMHRIKEESALEPQENVTTSPPSKVGFWEFMRTLIRPQYAVGFSTCLILLVFGLYYVNNNVESQEECSTLMACLTPDEMNSYIITNIEEFSTEDIVDAMPTEEVAEFQDKIPEIKEVIENVVAEPVVESTKANTEQSTMDKALEAAGAENLLDDLSEEDLLDEDEGIF